MKKNKFQIKREATFESFIDAGLNLLIDRAYDLVSMRTSAERPGTVKERFMFILSARRTFCSVFSRNVR